MRPIIKTNQNNRHVSAAAVSGKNRRCRGNSLIEVMIAILVIVIALLGISTSYVSGRRHLASQREYQTAALMASQKIEEVKALGYEGVSVSEEEEELSLGNYTYARHTSIELTATPSTDNPKPCKKVTVTINWLQHEARIVTYIGP